MIKGACYVRVSTDHQLENYSIEEQTERLKAFCRAKDIAIVKIYTDGGYSGGHLNRPALQQMLAAIERKEIETVMVYKLDRLSRSQKDTLLLIEDKFLANDVDFISLCENFDTSTPFGRAMIGILSVFAQLEKDQITERFTMGRIGRAKSGFYHGGGYAPTGYDYTEGRLIVNEYESMQVKALYERFSKGYSLHDCWRYMQNHYETKYGAWTSETLVRNVLKNNVYIGMVKFKACSYQGNHEPIIDQQLFQRVQDIFLHSQRNQSSFTRSPFKANNLLSSLIYCGNCGARFHGEHGNYSCYSRTKGDKKYVIDPNCKNKKWKIGDLDELVIKYISNLDFSSLLKAPGAEEPQKDYSKRLREIDKQLEKLIDLYQLGNLPMESITKKVNSLTLEKNTLLADLTLTNPSSSPVDLETSRDRILSLLHNGDLQEKRACLTNLIDLIKINDEDVNIILKT